MKIAPARFRPSTAGMVLLELIIALTIFAIVTLGLVTALDRAFGVSADREAADDATRGLRNQLVLLKAQTLAPGEKDLPNDGSGMTYHLAIAPEPTLDQKKQPILGLYRATLTASWKSENRTENRSVSTLVYQP